jgi:hypothetical protein
LPNLAALNDHDTTSTEACCLLSFGWGLAQPQIRSLVITAPGAYAASSSVEIGCDT